jgi:hypothetical protein
MDQQCRHLTGFFGRKTICRGNSHLLWSIAHQACHSLSAEYAAESIVPNGSKMLDCESSYAEEIANPSKNCFGLANVVQQRQSAAATAPFSIATPPSANKEKQAFS